MLRIGTSAPTFDSTAVVNGSVVELEWDGIHEDKVLVLLFDSIDSDDALGDLAALELAAEQLDRLDAKVAIVCRDDAYEVLSRLERGPAECCRSMGACPLLIDCDDRIASLYEMVTADGSVLWGHIVIDPYGIIRQLRSSARVDWNVDELIRCVEAVLQPDADWPC